MTLKDINRRLAAMNAPTIATLKAEWAEVCKAMADGYWRGTDADALAEIERIKTEIAILEDVE